METGLEDKRKKGITYIEAPPGHIRYKFRSTTLELKLLNPEGYIESVKLSSFGGGWRAKIFKTIDLTF